MAMPGSVVTDLESGALAELSLDIKQIDHRVGSANIGAHSPSQPGGQDDRQRGRIEEILVCNRWSSSDGWHLARAPGKAAVQIELRIGAFLGIENTKASADAPLVGGTVGDADARGKQIPVRVDQAISEPAIPRDLNANVAERHSVVKVTFACADQHRVQAGIHVHGGGKPRPETGIPPILGG